MQKNIENLVKGDYFSVKINILCDTKSLSCDLFSNRKYEDSVTIYNDKEHEMNGYVYSTNHRVSVTSSEIKGKSHKISFLINTVNIEQGEDIEGFLNIITDVGELSIPYKYIISDDEDTKTIKKITSIEDYHNLVIEDIDKALSIFGSKKIYKTKMMSDAKVLSYYDTLIKGSSKYVAFSEFFKVFGYDVSSYLLDNDDPGYRSYIDNKGKAISGTTDVTDASNIHVDDDIYQIIDKIQDKDLIDSLSITFVRKGYHNDIVFHILTKALSFGSTINNLYKAILESLPRNYDKKLPLYVYRYFYEDRSYSFSQKIALYENVVMAFDEIDDIYKLYYDEIRQFALSEIYQNKISESLVKLYKSILKVDIVNKDNASNILYLVRNHKITVKNKNIKYAIIKYKETTNETKYEINNGICYLPVFFDSYILLFEDIQGNIIYDVDFEIKVLFDEKEIENACLSICQDKNLFYFSKFIDIKEKQDISNIDIDMYFEIYDNLSLNTASICDINKKVVNYLFNKSIATDKITIGELRYLENIKFDILDMQDKKKILKIMLINESYSYIYNKIISYNINLLNDEDKMEFYEKSISTGQSFIDDVFIYLVYRYVCANNKSDTLILYLDNNFYGDVKDSFVLLDISKTHGIDTNNLSKKLLTKMFDNQSVDLLDEVFEYYNYKADTDYMMLLSYLTCKSYEYFCYNKKINQRYIDILIEYLLNNTDKLSDISIIYILSFTKYVSTLTLLNNNDMRRLLLLSIDILLSKDMVFAYYKKLNRHIRLSDNIMNKEYIEYHTDYDFIPRAKIRINNSTTENDVELINVYRNIYVKSISVYKNEIVTYKIYNSTNIESGVLEEGTLSYNDNDNLYQQKILNNKNTYEYINDIITYFNENNFNKTKQSIIDFEVKQEVTEGIFNI